MTSEPYPEVPREVLRPATPAKAGTISAILREKAAGRRNRVGDIWGDWVCAEAADAIDEIRKVRDGYADQAKFADPEIAPHFREFVRRIDAVLARH